MCISQKVVGESSCNLVNRYVVDQSGSYLEHGLVIHHFSLYFRI